MENTKQIRIT